MSNRFFRPKIGFSIRIPAINKQGIWEAVIIRIETNAFPDPSDPNGTKNRTPKNYIPQANQCQLTCSVNLRLFLKMYLIPSKNGSASSIFVSIKSSCSVSDNGAFLFMRNICYMMSIDLAVSFCARV